MVQSHLPGLDLQNSAHSYPSLSFSQKRHFVKKFDGILLDILAMGSSTPGRIDAEFREILDQPFQPTHFAIAEEKDPRELRLPDK